MEERAGELANTLATGAMLVTLILAFILKYTIGIRLGAEEEAGGIDEAEHAETAYEFAAVGASAIPHRIGAEGSPNGLDERAGEKVEAE